MRIKSLLFLLLLTFLVSLHARGSHPAEPVSKNSALESQLFYQLLLGELSVRDEDPASAFALLLDVAHQTGDPAVFRRAVQIALQAHSGDSALQAARAWSAAWPTSLEANRFVLQILLRLNRTALALEPLKRELSLTPKDQRRDTIWAIPGYFEPVSDRQLAATLVQEGLASALRDPSLGATAWAVVGRLWLAAGNQTLALSAARKAQTLALQDEHPALLALALMRADTAKAQDLVKAHLPHASVQFRMAYVKTLLALKREAEAQTELEKLSADHAQYADAWLIQGALALQAGRLEPAEQHFQHYLALTEPTPESTQEANRGRSQAFFSLAQIAVQRKDLTLADSWLQRVEHPQDRLNAQLRRAALMAKQGQVKLALEHIRAQSVTFPGEAQIKQSAEIQILREYKMYHQALHLINAALENNPQDLDLAYELAMVYEKLGNFADMEKTLNRLISAKPGDAQAYNALGYSLAERSERLPQAKDLIKKALERAPNDPFILDSLAWVEFRLGNHEEARRLLQDAFKRRPDAEIAAHLGEVLWQLHKTADALEIFSNARRLNPDNETLLDTLKRLQIKL